MRTTQLLGAIAMFGALTGVAAAGEQSVKIGVLTDLTSFASTAMGPGSVLAGQLAVEHFGGKVLGKPVELISADMQSKPDLAVQIAHRWYEAAERRPDRRRSGVRRRNRNPGHGHTGQQDVHGNGCGHTRAHAQGLLT